jgi:hypothetical protein
MAGSVRRRRKRAHDRYGVLLMSGALCALIALAGMYIYFRSQRVELDKETLCPVSGPRSLTVLLIDRTDPLTAVQQGALRKHLDAMQHEIERYGGLVVYSVGPIGEALLRPEASRLCNPGRREDIHPAIGNPHLMERKWREQFAAPLAQLFTQLVKPHEAATSPIMESIQSVAITALRGSQLNQIPRRLVIVSDMLQHTPAYSQYSTVASFEAFRQMPYYRQVRTDLTGIEVHIVYVRRDTRTRVQGRAHIEFWQQYIADMGGKLTHVLALEG